MNATARAATALVVPLVLAGIWQAAISFGLADGTIWASPAAVLRAAREALAQGDLGGDLLASLQRDLAGLALGIPLGLATGLALGLSRAAARLFNPSLTAIRQVALFSWVPVISVWLGNDEPAKIAFIGFATFFPVMLATQQGVRGVDAKYLEVAAILNMRPTQILWSIILPAALPAALSGIHLALIYGWLATIGAEYLFSAGPGIGSELMTARAQFRMDQVIVGMILIAGIGMLFNQAAGVAERRLLRARGLA